MNQYSELKQLLSKAHCSNTLRKTNNTNTKRSYTQHDPISIISQYKPINHRSPIMNNSYYNNHISSMNSFHLNSLNSNLIDKTTRKTSLFHSNDKIDNETIHPFSPYHLTKVEQNKTHSKDLFKYVKSKQRKHHSSLFQQHKNSYCSAKSENTSIRKISFRNSNCNNYSHNAKNDYSCMTYIKQSHTLDSTASASIFNVGGVSVPVVNIGISNCTDVQKKKLLLSDVHDRCAKLLKRFEDILLQTKKI